MCVLLRLAAFNTKQSKLSYFIELPVPEEVMVRLVGYFTKIGVLHYDISLITIFRESFTGMFISYILGGKLGRLLFEEFG